MTNKVKTTQIEKKWKDKKTGEWRSLTITYAKVIDRLKEFRKENPQGLIETSPEFIDGNIIFKTRILKDKADTNSAEATGHAMAHNDGSEKQFEKLETISVGRALALLGYDVTGDIASDEEMEEYNKWKNDKVDDAVIKLNDTKTLEELKQVWMSLGSLMADSRIIEAKDKKKEALNEKS